MEFRANQTVNNSAAKPPAAMPSFASNKANLGGVMNSDNNKKMWLVPCVVLLVLVLGGLGYWLLASTMSGDSLVKKDQYQAVFLANNQVYFCHVSDINSNYVHCKDIYYLQVQQDVQPDNKDNKDKQPPVSLVKLGGELHGPEDEMFIESKQVLFWENLKADGKVAKAIQDAKKAK